LRKILITGSNGQLGRELISTLTPKHFDLIALNRSQLDISDFQQVRTILSEYKPDLVLNCAAFTNLDQAEIKVNESYKVNSEGPNLLARACEYTSSKLLHFSTDAVFSSNQFKFFGSKDPTNPVSQYGKSKADGEKLLLEKYAKNVWIIRSSWLYGNYGGRFVHNILASIRKKLPIKVVDDQFGQPTNTRNFGLYIRNFILNPPDFGIYHYADFGYTSRYHFVKQILLDLGFEKYNIVPTNTLIADNLALRPKYSLLSLENDSISLGTKFLPWQESLNEFIRMQEN
jgi:dTDP-4-dehydrorhamnose reductase